MIGGLGGASAALPPVGGFFQQAASAAPAAGFSSAASPAPGVAGGLGVGLGGAGLPGGGLGAASLAATSAGGVVAPHGPRPGGNPAKCPFLAAQSAFSPKTGSVDGDLLSDVRQTFDFKNPAVLLESYDALARNYGFTRQELASLTLWGHTVSKLPADPSAQGAAFDGYVRRALNDDQSLTSFDNVFVRDVPGLRAHYESMLGDFGRLNAEVGGLLARL